MPSFGDTSGGVKRAPLSDPGKGPQALSPTQRERYARHLVLEEVGEEGQLALLRSRILLVGVGGLGSPAALYLAAAGVGTLGLADLDTVEESNLQRQVLHSTERLGEPKVESARAALEALNPEIEVIPHQLRLGVDNVGGIVSDYDLVMDCVDNYDTRYLVNDAAMEAGKPVVHGSVYRFEGHVTVFDPQSGPCYRCLYPQPPPPELAPDNAAVGLLGALPGVVGCLQAMEALKLCLGRGDSLVGRLVVYDALGATFRELRVRPDKACPVCSAARTQPMDDAGRSC
jgi:sulfur-carrier protein adenylyltransferase/sulfurtransferase